MSNAINVLLADDHTIVRQGLARLLEEQADIRVVGEATNGRKAVDLAKDLIPDIVIMDIAMPRMNGIEAAKRIRKHLPKTKILILSMYFLHFSAEYRRAPQGESPGWRAVHLSPMKHMCPQLGNLSQLTEFRQC